jgi:vacuolar-type H+-ATPase subunit E/Vma4
LTEEEQVPSKNEQQQAFSRMREEIEAIANRKAKEKMAEAKDQSKDIVENAKNEAKVVKNQIISEAKSEAEKIKIREISRKKLAVKMDYLETRESILDEINIEAKSELQKFTKSDDYAGFLTKLVKSTGISIGGGDLILHLRTEDKSHFTEASLKELSKEIEKITQEKTSIKVSDKDLNALGGITMVRDDDKLFIDNTFESRLDRSSEATRVALLEVLS